jgi:GrpB-like predicted nucleotidyltransferase (UPF0157 family)
VPLEGEELDRRLDEVLIGGRERVEIVIEAYNSAWPELFELERQRLGVALGGRAILIEHIGSTSVPGLAAKPIIDILVTVEDPQDHRGLTLELEDAGYQLRVREPRHRMFRTPARDVHVHIWADSDPEVARYLAFRDQLRCSATDRAAYEQLKRELAAKRWTDMNHYATAKGPLIEQILDRARRP